MSGADDAAARGLGGTDASALDRRLLPTAGVARLIGEALLDLLLLPPRLLLAVATCTSRQREIAALVRAKGNRAA